MKYRRIAAALVVAVSLLVVWTGLGFAQGPEPGSRPSVFVDTTGLTSTSLGRAFSFQGQLVASSGAPVSATCSFVFSLWDRPRDPNDPDVGIVGQTISQSLEVLDGRFTSQPLDFLVPVFTGDPRFLQVRVNCPGDSDWTLLLPRQQLLPAPYAFYAVSTGSLQGQPVTSTAPSTGQVLKWDGASWTPGLDANTQFITGVGIQVTGSRLDVNPTVVQMRVISSCLPGWAISSISMSGNIVCEQVLLAATGVLEAADLRYWRLDGNAGVAPTATIGTTNGGVALTLITSGTVGLRLVPSSGTPNVIGGHSGNSFRAGEVGVTIGGGGSASGFNFVDSSYSTVAGGEGNIISLYDWATVAGGRSNLVVGLYGTVGGGKSNQLLNADYGTIAGGSTNRTSASYGTVGGGSDNTAGQYAVAGGGFNNLVTMTYGTVAGGTGNVVTGTGWAAAIGGGVGNTATGDRGVVGGGTGNRASGSSAVVAGGSGNAATAAYSLVAGGSANTASGQYSVVAGGYGNQATGDYSFAAGRNALAQNQGSFVWADATGANLGTTASNQFMVRAAGGVWLTGTVGITFTTGASAPFKVNGGDIWNLNRQGAGTGMDADLLDGLHGSDYTVDSELNAQVAGHGYITKSLADGLYVDTYLAGAGLNLTSTTKTFWVDYGEVQKRLTASCTAGNAIRAVGVDGAVTCASAVTSVTAGTGLLDSGTSEVTISLDTAYMNNRYWRMGGVSGLTTVSATLGTTDAVTVTLNVSGTAALRLIPTGGAPNLVGGYSGNSAGAVDGAVVAGGGVSGNANQVAGSYGAVGGGAGNVVTGTYSTIAGGAGSQVTGTFATVGGGSGNLVTGNYATVPGGLGNSATGDYSLAAGRRAAADAQGSFVWGDSTDAAVVSSAANQFVVRASGGVFLGAGDIGSVDVEAGTFISTSTGARLSSVGTWDNSSDRVLKTGFAPVDGSQVLARLAEMPVATWSFRADPAAVQHMGPVAQDFYAAFGVGADDRHISTIDADGVALAAIKELDARDQEYAAAISRLESDRARQQAAIGDLERRLASLEDRASSAPDLFAMPWFGFGAGLLAVLGGVGLFAGGAVLGGRRSRNQQLPAERR